MKNQKHIFIAGLIAAFATLIVFYVYPYNEYTLKNHVRQMMKDPESAKFGRISIVGKSACLEVNVKNSWGAYAGVSLFKAAKMPDGEWFAYKGADTETYNSCMHAFN